jgi:thiamine pyrophosphokinase
MITNIYYLHAPIDSNIFTTIHNLLKHTQQDKILSLTFFGTCIDQTYHTILHNIKQAVYTILSKKILITFIPEQTISSSNPQLSSSASFLRLNVLSSLN